MALNMHVQTDKNGNEMPTKKHSTGRIDGMTSLIMAIGRSMLEGASVYEDRGLQGF
jgi:phage terminase large subunit-like protein